MINKVNSENTALAFCKLPPKQKVWFGSWEWPGPAQPGVLHYSLYYTHSTSALLHYTQTHTTSTQLAGSSSDVEHEVAWHFYVPLLPYYHFVQVGHIVPIFDNISIKKISTNFRVRPAFKNYIFFLDRIRRSGRSPPKKLREGKMVTRKSKQNEIF